MNKIKRDSRHKFTALFFCTKKHPPIGGCFSKCKNYLAALALVTLGFFTTGAGLAPGTLATFTLGVLAAVRKHEVQTLIFIPSIFLVCKLMSCLFKVLILEWERVAPFIEPRPHKSQVFPIFVVYLSRPLT